MSGSPHARIGVKAGDSKEIRNIDHIVAWTFHIAKDIKPGTISRSWVADFLKRSETFVKRNWSTNPYELLLNEGDESEQRALSQESKEVIRRILTRPKKMSVRAIVKEVERIRRKPRSYGTVYRFLREEKARAFHQISKPKITELGAANRLLFCEFMREWNKDDFMFLAPSNEFYIYAEQKPNYQNDRIWAYAIDDIPEEIRVKQKSKYPICIGIFICFTAKSMCWRVKEAGESWDGEYFRNKILIDTLIPFLKDSQNVLDINETTFLHDKAPCMKAIATQQLLKSNSVDFFDNSQWPGFSPDLNACENLGAILKDRVEESIAKDNANSRGSKRRLLRIIETELSAMAEDTDLFEALLKSYPKRLEAVKKAGGWHTEY